MPKELDNQTEQAQGLAAAGEQLAAQVLATEPTDLQALAAVHTAFARLSEHLAAASDDLLPLEKLSDCSARGQKLIEQIILAEVPDAAAALASVGQTVAELQALLQGPGSQGPTPAAAVSSAAPPAGADAPQASQPDLNEIPVNPADLPLLREFIAEARGHIESAEGELLKLEEMPDNLESVNAIFRAFHTIKGVAGFLNLRQIGALAHAAENLLDLARNGKLQLVGGVVDIVLESLDAMKAMLAQLDDAARDGSAIPARAELPDLLCRLRRCAAGETTSKTQAAATPAMPTTPATPARPQAEAAAASASKQVDATTKVSTERLDLLIDTVGELVIAQSMVSQEIAGRAGESQRLSRNMAQLGKITRELQGISMSMRMVPIAGVFQKMARLVRDLGRKFGKEINFAVRGEETELDRNVVDAISDPLMHMVRNAVDHGLEDPETRAAAGKPRAGQIELRAYHQAGSIVIEVTDDGRGLNKAKILKKAIAAGIVREGQELSENELFRLIFHAGLSTAEKVTDVSGRGVGMDVVRKNVEALRGRIDIASTEGKGSVFTIRLPLTLAVIDGMIARVGEHRYIVPLTSIVQSLQPKAEQISTVQGRGEMCLVRGQLLPLVRLHRLFGVKPQSEDPSRGLVMIVQDDDRRCALLVDQLLGQQQVVIKSLGEGIGRVAGISGGAILGDGLVSLILDVPGLISITAEQ